MRCRLIPVKGDMDIVPHRSQAPCSGHTLSLPLTASIRDRVSFRDSSLETDIRRSAQAAVETTVIFDFAVHYNGSAAGWRAETDGLPEGIA